MTKQAEGRAWGSMLSRTSRWMLGFSALLLSVAFVTPVWRIDLIAPQYPEGLGMLIKVNTITGLKPADLDNINGLNHYIGMKAIVPEAIPVLQVMPIVLAILVVLGILTALYGRRWGGWTWLGFVAAGGVAGLYEFWSWSYDYGHNLAADAIIKVPGMSYQPPMIGSKQLLNFTAISWPDVGGVAAAVAFAITLAALLIRRAPKAPRAEAHVSHGLMGVVAGCLLVLGVPGRSSALPLPDTIVVDPAGSVRSLSSALRLVRTGGTVVVNAGRYSEHDLAVNRPVTIAGRPGAMIDGAGKGNILLVTADDVTITGLHLTGVGVRFTSDPAAIRVSGSNCRITKNQIDNAFFGIYLAKSNDCRIEGNSLTASGKTEAVSGNGIHLWSARGVRIAGNSVAGFRDGIYFEFVHDTEVVGNLSERNLRYGLHFMYSDDCTYLKNTFSRNGSGVAVMYTKRVHMTANRFANNRGSAAYGLLLKEISDSRLDRNVFENNTIGLFADGADRVRATRNEFVRNGWAVKVGGSTQDGSFTGNNFEDNTFDVTTSSQRPSTKFDGNFWSSYKGYDLNRDGIGDVPHPPVRLFSIVIENSPQAIVLMRSALASLLDAAERAIPSLTPSMFVDPRPSMRRLS